MKGTFTRIANSKLFQALILGAIVLASITVGLETNPGLVEKYGSLLSGLEHLILWLFVAECVIKIGAEGRQPWRYFQNGWNVFDFVIVIALLLPGESQFFAVLRIARLLRVFKLVRALPRLQILVRALLESIPSMGYVVGLLSLLFYAYGVAGTFLFAKNDPFHFGTLSKSILSLFTVVTLEGWNNIMYIQMYGCDRFGYEGMPEMCTDPTAFPIVGAFFFLSFVLIGGMVVINLFVGIIITSIEGTVEEFHWEQQQRRLEKLKGKKTEKALQLESQLLEYQQQLREIQSGIERVRQELTNLSRSQRVESKK